MSLKEMMPLTKSDLYRELMMEMRWRRETEFKLLTVHIAVSTACFVLLVQTQGKELWLVILASCLSIAFITASWLAILAKVKK